MTYQLTFVVNFLACYFVMKIISVCLTPKKERIHLKRFFFTIPFMSLRSIRHRSPEFSYSMLKNIFIFGILGSLTYVITKKILEPLSYFDIVLISPSIYFATESIAALGQLLIAPFQSKRFPIHLHPLKATSLGQFWGKHWNLWVQDWLKDITRKFKNRSHHKKLMITFFFSGIFHEFMFNLPFWIVFRKSCFGTMMLYFSIQAMALMFEKKFLKNSPAWLTRIFLWISVLLPSPIFIGPPLLHFIGLNYE